jgi:hypothetical protein
VRQWDAIFGLETLIVVECSCRRLLKNLVFERRHFVVYPKILPVQTKMQGRQIERVRVDRPSALYFGPYAQKATLFESPSDRFDMSIVPDAVDAKMTRVEFSWRAPAQGLLMHPRAWLEFDVQWKPRFDVTCMGQASGNSSFTSSAAGYANGNTTAGTHRALRKNGVYAFGEGDPLLAACESATVVLNGSSLTTPSPTLWSRAFMRANIRNEDAQEIFGQCGGGYDQYDNVGGRVFSLGSDGGLNAKSQGFSLSVDSGVQKRARNLYGCITNSVVIDNANATSTKTVKCRWPITAGGLFQPYFGAEVPRGSPLDGLPMGLANCNSVSTSFLFRQNVLETLIRDLSAGANGDNIGFGGRAAREADDLLINTSTVRLRVRYYRLAPGREVPASQSIKIFRPMVALGPAMPTIAANNLAASGIAVNGNAAFTSQAADQTSLIPSGRDHINIPTIAGGAQPVATAVAIAKHGALYECEFLNIAYPMLPAYLLLCAPKDSYSFTHKVGAGNAVGCRGVLNRDSSLSIKQVEISINTTERTYKFTRDTTCFEDQRILLDDTMRNSIAGAFGGDYDAFRRRNHYVLLKSDQYCPIPSMSPGVVSPVNISVIMRLQNECVYASPLTAIVGHGAAHGAAGSPEPAIAADRIRSRPVVVAFFQRSVLSIAPSSASIAVQSYTMGTAAEQLAQNR